MGEDPAEDSSSDSESVKRESTPFRRGFKKAGCKRQRPIQVNITLQKKKKTINKLKYVTEALTERGPVVSEAPKISQLEKTE